MMSASLSYKFRTANTSSVTRSAQTNLPRSLGLSESVVSGGSRGGAALSWSAPASSICHTPRRKHAGDDLIDPDLGECFMVNPRGGFTESGNVHSIGSFQPQDNRC